MRAKQFREATGPMEGFRTEKVTVQAIRMTALFILAPILSLPLVESAVSARESHCIERF